MFGWHADTTRVRTHPHDGRLLTGGSRTGAERDYAPVARVRRVVARDSNPPANLLLFTQRRRFFACVTSLSLCSLGASGSVMVCCPDLLSSVPWWRADHAYCSVLGRRRREKTVRV